MSELAHVEAARQRLRDRDRARRERYRGLWERAATDCRVIIDMIAREYHPTRVYQWGSLLRPERFRDYSDIDIAVEGIGDAETFFHMLGAAHRVRLGPRADREGGSRVRRGYPGVWEDRV